MAGDGDPQNLKMENMCTISWLECQYAKRCLFHTLAGRWGEAGSWVLGRQGRGWFGVKVGPGRPAQKKTGGALPARFAGAKKNGEADDTKMIPKRYQNDTKMILK